MRFLIDERLHESLVDVAHSAGFEATHVNHFGLSGWPDWAIIERVIKGEFTFVTNNRADFLRLFAHTDLHAGLFVLVQNVAPPLQRAFFRAALQFAEGTDLVNSVIEVRLVGADVRCTRYELPPG